MGFEVHLKPIFGHPKVEWAAGNASTPPRRFLFHVHASPDSLHLRIHVTDFHCDTWEAVRSVSQLDDMRDSIGIGGSWSDFIDYLIASVKSEDVKLVLEGHSNSDGAAYAKLVAQKSKGMPLISISLTKLVGTAGSEAIANLSLQLFEEFKSIHEFYVEEKQRSFELSKAISAEKERNASIQSQLEQYSKRQKLQRISSSDKVDVSGLFSNGLKSSPDKEAARDINSTTVANRVVPAYRRAKVRGALLQDTEEEHK
ncbi:PREDICTED: uncharacterized protein LOC103326933 [Prunus mume]|uniref:Uncharacterized protein LOC103326933 n=1 Tax=Prunus mume TaxID=102107 RepID=A0ABM0NNF7_PRUMU|nr:PREDICTED: uncharacterized protein LOC103326933 [Prunus mume]XP_016648812.1 PREDICTED: uncharacterized protein LOC103326933 [Prunus mume]